MFCSPIQILASAGGAFSGRLRGLTGGLSGLAEAFGEGSTIRRRSQTDRGEVRASLK